MLLRASGQSQGSSVDVQVLRDKNAAAGSGIAHAEALLNWADAALSGNEAETAAARGRVIDEMGAAAAVDAAAIVGNFERMTRIADATGIPLDPPVNALASDLQDELGLRDFPSAGNTSRPTTLSVHGRGR